MVLQSSESSHGSQAIGVAAVNDRDDWWNFDMRVAVKRSLTDPTTANALVAITQDVKITSDQEARFGIGLYDTGGTKTNLIEFGVPLSVGSPAPIFVNDPDNDTGHSWTAGVWETVVLDLDYVSETIDVFYGDTQVANDVPFLASGGLGRIALLTNDAIWSAGSTMYYDDLAIEAIPVPGSLLLGAIGLAAIKARRRRA